MMGIELVQSLADLHGGRGGYWEDRSCEWYGGSEVLRLIRRALGDEGREADRVRQKALRIAKKASCGLKGGARRATAVSSCAGQEQLAGNVMHANRTR